MTNQGALLKIKNLLNYFSGSDEIGDISPEHVMTDIISMLQYSYDYMEYMKPHLYSEEAPDSGGVYLCENKYGDMFDCIWSEEDKEFGFVDKEKGQLKWVSIDNDIVSWRVCLETYEDWMTDDWIDEE